MQVEFFSYDVVTSTNDIAFQKLRDAVDVVDKLFVVTAEHQTKGRGRNNKEWHGDSAQNLYYSCSLRHIISEQPMSSIQIIGGLACYNLIFELLGSERVRLKYPNDVYVLFSDTNGNLIPKKLSGIIAEHHFSGGESCDSILGIGINNKQEVFPNEISDLATSLSLNGVLIETEELKFRLTDHIVRLLESDYDSVFQN